MRILLLSPEFPDSPWRWRRALRLTRRRASFPPLGLLTVAAMLPAKWEKRLVDLNVTRLRERDLDWADYAFIGGIAAQRASAYEIIAQCDAAGVPIVAGGPLFKGEMEKFPEVAHFVLDEAELTLSPFLADLARGTAKRVYTADGYADMHTSPTPMWQLADLRRYASASVQFSRGCPSDCEFCNVAALHGRVSRTKSTAQVIGELNRLYETGWRRSVLFVDDNLIGNNRQVKMDLLPALARWQSWTKGIPFASRVSMNIVADDGLLRLMGAAGFSTVFARAGSGLGAPDVDASQADSESSRARDFGHLRSLFSRRARVPRLVVT